MKILRSFLLVIGFFVLIFFSTTGQGIAQDSLKIMYYNVLNYPGSTPGRVSYFRTTNQYVGADIILITELISDAGAETLLQDGLNVFGETKYNKAVFTDGYDTDNMLFYNSDKLVLYSQDTINTALRQINEYVLYYKSWDIETTEDTIFFYFYSAHLKASSGSTNENKRLAEILEFKNHLNSLPNAENIFFGGDLNLYKSYEPAYSEIINPGSYTLNDPLPAGYWHNNESFSSLHTQSTRTSQFGGGASGGLDDRFDFIFFSDDVVTGTNKVSYIPGSCIAFGNDGSHFNKALIDTPVNPSVPDSVTEALYYMSDHLPVLCDIAVESSTVPLSRELAVKVCLEGAFNGSDMNTDIIQLIPLDQPFNTAPWNYEGAEKVTSIPDNVVDWILIDLRDAPDADSASSLTTFEKKAAFLLNDGRIVDVDGSSDPLFTHSFIHSLYVVLWHRNHLGIMSATSLSDISGVYSFDFTTSNLQAYGNNAQKNLGNGIFGMIAGDANSDGTVDVTDKTLWQTFAGKPGFYSADFNLDGQVNNSDKNDCWIQNEDEESQVPD
jgi:hypothetical protein